ncbi:phage tail sheath subtilisin-like domain-containing protein [Marinomonas transparens]|uniref:Phage tail sheath subtilisin-like domain-containing protein n=1 Tax=Marinomonas transparens TaxID=2795388 RepID=A0A934JJC5_9GAMM|nr:phage tail sheath subtilisin-like domain-containing protein [Marinomonas transparens]MBJ7537165.1 phage tail sheath subtilisin-like domain-containing protein [Marinomonas transparens]
MAISFDNIPATLRNPGTYIEFNNELAGASSTMFKVAVAGQRLASGSQAAGIPVRVTDPSQAMALFGQGSMLAAQCEAFLNANTDTEMWAIALDDDTNGTAAVGSITVATAPVSAGTLALYVGGVRISVGISAGDDVATVATSIAAQINAALDLPVTATSSAGVVTVTARHKGEVLNGLDLRASFYDEAMPAGLTLTFAALSGGAGNPDVAVALDAMGDEWFNWLVCPYTDTANLVQVETELGDRFGPMRQIGCRAFVAFSGTHGETGTFGSNRNNPHVTCMSTGTSPTPTYLVSAINAAVAAKSLAIDPARPLQTLVLKGMLAPSRHERWSNSERNLLLFDGISTFTVGSDGTCRIERQITMYQQNSSGLSDASYLDICTPETLERIRYEQRLMISQQYPRHKLASDGTQYGAGQAIVTPQIIRGQLLSLYRTMELKGWVEAYDGYAEKLIVERDIDDANRVNWRDTPNLVNQLRITAGKQQFII